MTTLLALAQNDSLPEKRNIFKKAYQGVAAFVKEFNNVDTSYIEPQKYKFTTMLMSTYSYEMYRIKVSRDRRWSSLQRRK